MKILAVILLLIIFPLSLFAQKADWTVEISSTNANLRGTPSASGKVITEVVKGQVFKVFLTQGEWYLVQTPAYVGWLHKSVVIDSQLIDYILDKAGLSQTKIEAESQPKYLSDAEDNGYDVGLVRSKTADLVDAQGKSLLQMSNNDELAIIKRPDSGEYVRVIHIESGRNGYVLKKDISLYYTRKPKSSESPFSERRSESYKNPEITVSNTTDRVLRLSIGDKNLELTPGTSQTVTLDEGDYDFFASAANVRPLIGKKNFSKGIIYSWTFYIK